MNNSPTPPECVVCGDRASHPVRPTPPTQVPSPTPTPDREALERAVRLAGGNSWLAADAVLAILNPEADR